MEFSSRNIIILSSCAWGIMLQRPHHMAKALSKLGNTVNFIEYGGLTLNGPDPFSRDLAITNAITYRRKVGGITVYRPLGSYKSVNVLTAATTALIEHLIDTADDTTAGDTVIIAYMPHHISIVNNVKRQYRLVYDCVDDHTDLEYSYWSSPGDIENERLMLAGAELVLTTSSALYLSKSKVHPRVLLSKNAVDLDSFPPDNCDSPSHAAEEPNDIKGLPHPRVCYIGAVDKWFNEELFYEIVSGNADMSFIVIGPVKDGMLKRTHGNLHVLGVKPHEKLVGYLNHMDIGLIPFRDDSDLIINCDPIKLYEYLACGLPVVSTALPELCLGYEFVRPCRSPEEMGKCLREFSNAPGLDVQSVSTFLKENSWIQRARALMAALEDRDKPIDCQKTISSMGAVWLSCLEKQDIPILRSLYAMSLMKSDLQKSRIQAYRAYATQMNRFTLKCLIEILIESDLLEEASAIIEASRLVSELNKAELRFAAGLGDERLLKIKMYYCIGKIEKLHDIVESLPPSPFRIFEKANYLSATGRGNDANMLYVGLKHESSLADSPVLAQKFSKMELSLHEKVKVQIKAAELIEKYLGRSGNLAAWNGLFTYEPPCDLCGNTEKEPIATRPDGQVVVKCAKCGLASLSKLPDPQSIATVYTEGFLRERSLTGLRTDYSPQDQQQILGPRLEWINASVPFKPGKCLLDSGSFSGNFARLAEQTGWSVHSLAAQDMYCGRLKAGNLKSDSFDCVALWDSIEHFISPKGELTEIFRVLRPGGRIYMDTPNHSLGLIKGRDWLGYNTSFEHLYFFEPGTLIRLLTDVGFIVNDCFSHAQNDWNMANVRGIHHVLLVSARKP